ncbi:YcnI family protein [Sediminicoccus sp. KRV36]|uniref:YcnI family protein n=1 Tax=Sediminicoccus sp. KRV36 TaxID=3133721 RepID=UPI00200D81E6|nr:YcnI family protein [Sediminicoccus rosea]UPY35212.1 YcnI family protein [Sediminicoccus rosea]
MKRILTLLLALATPAAAHVTIAPPEVPANSYARLAFRVGHGCAGAATIAIEVALPEGITMARPMPKPGWEIAIETRPLPRPVSGGHGLVREAPSGIAWRGGPLPDAHYEEFVLLIRAPDMAGATLSFPVMQRCEGGAQHAWIELPTAEQSRPRSPAATLRLGAR